MTHSKSRGRLTRSNQGYLAGVAEGLGRHYGVDPWLLRLGWIVAVLAFGTGILLYLALWWLVPREGSVPVEPTIWIRSENGNRPPLARTTVDRKVWGVCGGLARRWGWDPTWVRLGALALFTFSGGLAIFAYLAGAILMPSASDERPHRDPHPVEL